VRVEFVYFIQNFVFFVIFQDFFYYFWTDIEIEEKKQMELEVKM